MEIVGVVFPALKYGSGTRVAGGKPTSWFTPQFRAGPMPA